MEENFTIHEPSLTTLKELDASVSSLLLGHIHLDSRQLKENDVFVAIQGSQHHGMNYLASALKQLVAVVISDRDLTNDEQVLLDSQIKPPRVIVLPNLEGVLGKLASWFYSYPSRKIKVVGITGTNGKTSSAFFTAQLLDEMQQRVALIGTLGNGPLDDLQNSINTTPDAITVHRMLREFIEQGMQWCVMEVSSHALSLGRVQGVEFESVAMTQITRDHIDFHGTEKAYREAKKRLFTDYQSKHKIINIADETGVVLAKQLQNENAKSQIAATNNLIIYNANANNKNLLNKSEQQSLLERNLFLSVKEVEYGALGIFCDYEVNQRIQKIHIPLMGGFNVENCFCALSILLAAGFDLNRVNSLLSNLKNVQGRMQLVNQQPTVLIDFAHTPDALEKLLQAIKTHLSASNARLTLVFGCGGDRDKGKRPLMGAIAEKFADKVVLTSDNPRTEDPLTIIADIRQGFTSEEGCLVVENREQAILEALSQSSLDEIIIIAGKGHEDYQDINGVKIPFSDESIVRSWAQTKELEQH